MKTINVLMWMTLLSSPALACMYCPPPAPSPISAPAPSAKFFFTPLDILVPMGEPIGLGAGDDRPPPR